MASRAGQKIKLTSIDELLCVPETEGTVDLDVRAIYPFEKHPFKVLDDEKMDELVESIKESGVLTPVLVRPDDEGTYEMISGHRRLHAAIEFKISHYDMKHIISANKILQIPYIKEKHPDTPTFCVDIIFQGLYTR